MAEVAKALQERKAAKAKFTRKKNAFFTAVAKKENMGDIEGNFNELTKAWRDVEGKHDNYIVLLEGDEAPEKEEAWINELQNTYSDANSVYNRCASENLLKAKEDEMSAKFEGLAKKKASLEAMFVGPSLVPRPSLRETTSGLPNYCCCCNTKCSWSSSGIKTVFIEPSILSESSVLPDMVSGVG